MKSLKHLNKYFFKYKWLLLVGGIFVVAQNFGAIYPAQVVRRSLDAVVDAMKNISGQNSAVYRDEMIKTITHQVGLFLLLIIAVALIRGILMFLIRRDITIIVWRIRNMRIPRIRATAIINKRNKPT